MTVVTASRPFTEVAAALDKALAEIKSKKEKFDEATKTVNETSKAYEEAKSNAQFLRDEMEKSLNDSMGAPSGRVRVSG